MKKLNKPSVTQILGNIYPFDQDALSAFQFALSKEWIDNKRAKNDIKEWSIADKSMWLRYDDVMKNLTTLWTIIHSVAFDLWTLWFCNNFKNTIYEPYVNSVIKFFSETEAKTIAWEIFIETDDYYWISDWLLLINWKIKLIDYKTWWAYKWLYWIANKILKKDWTPYSRTKDIEKTSLQLSMYEEWLKDKYKIDWLLIVWFTEQGYFIFEWISDLSKYIDWKKNLTNNLITNKISIWQK